MDLAGKEAIMPYDFRPNEIFGIEDAAPSSLTGTELLYESEFGKPGGPDYLREEVRRNKAGKYYMYVKRGGRACYFNNLSYDSAGQEFTFPVTPKALALWAGKRLCGSDFSRAFKGFNSNVKIKETVWEYQQGTDETQPGFIYEYLRKTDTDTYALFSTDYAYPCFGCNIAEAKQGRRKVRYDLYLYYITEDTARRWAEARGMDQYTFREVFG